MRGVVRAVEVVLLRAALIEHQIVEGFSRVLVRFKHRSSDPLINTSRLITSAATSEGRGPAAR